ncbi:Glutamate decarboxylase B [Penicillium lividum]|nr:Glutamate decarboxylase B [Penicillium lividum]
MAADMPLGQDLGTEVWDLIPPSLLKNVSSVEEYPSIARFQERCISILADLWSAPSINSYFGTATTGSSETIQLGGLAMKRNWQLKNPEDADSPRIVPVTKQHTIDPVNLAEHLDHNTIGVFLTLGNTYTGHFDPIQRIADFLDRYELATGNDIPIHVDAASGGFVAPFTPNNNTFVWDFRLPRVKSINASGHKFELSSLSVGWLIWRENSYVPKDLLLESSYLKGSQSAFTLSFSRPSTPVVVQYYQLHHLGMDGYRKIIQNSISKARLLSEKLEATGYFHCWSDIHRPISRCHEFSGKCVQAKHPGLPVVAFRLSDEFLLRNPAVSLSSFSDSMHDQNISIPSFTVSKWGPEGHEIHIMRIVVREDFTLELIESVLKGLVHVAESGGLTDLN